MKRAQNICYDYKGEGTYGSVEELTSGVDIHPQNLRYLESCVYIHIVERHMREREK